MNSQARAAMTAKEQLAEVEKQRQSWESAKHNLEMRYGGWARTKPAAEEHRQPVPNPMQESLPKPPKAPTASALHEARTLAGSTEPPVVSAEDIALIADMIETIPAAAVQVLQHAESNPFAALGISRLNGVKELNTVNKRELLKAFRRLALELHPDRCAHPLANDAMQALNAAYERTQAPMRVCKRNPRPTHSHTQDPARCIKCAAPVFYAYCRAISHHTLRLFAEGHGLAWTCFEQVERICIPDFDRLVARPRHNLDPVRGKRNRHDIAAVRVRLLAQQLQLACQTSQQASVLALERQFEGSSAPKSHGIPEFPVRLSKLEMLSEKTNAHSSMITSVAFSPDGTKIVSGSYDQTIKIWDSTDKLELLSEKTNTHSDTIRSVAFSQDGTKIVSGSFDKTIQVCRL
eukprot:jgi/Chrpa1/11811/Chrysochromulina_OHIO_Genome00010161-RA